ncbi:DUF1127 domain-containing protein [Marinomonas sp. TW1]|uniref:DUF1127 domain-containing protein n=1 Tax=Marinomonas sp. TW1 TaxID=1561203 RepID=UPI0007AF1E65|nr:DUF1127 domain-containing protein [Marinomonas sp. TW1]KZN15246.1 hypothetical protein OA79_00175 [Marinomonas sp. TW1]
MTKLTTFFASLVSLFSTKNHCETKQAINELKSYSDRELAELGISRFNIKDAVQYGRQSAV